MARHTHSVTAVETGGSHQDNEVNDVFGRIRFIHVFFYTSCDHSGFMPSLRTHCAISMKRTGNGFAELHRWIDEPTSRLGSDHRMERHFYNEGDKNYIKGYWDAKRAGLGEKAVIEWLFHIAIDNLATAFKMSSKSFSYGPKTYNLMEFGFGRSGYIHCEFDRVEEGDLHFIFEEELEEDY